MLLFNYLKLTKQFFDIIHISYIIKYIYSMVIFLFRVIIPQDIEKTPKKINYDYYKCVQNINFLKLI